MKQYLTRLCRLRRNCSAIPLIKPRINFVVHNFLQCTIQLRFYNVENVNVNHIELRCRMTSSTTCFKPRGFGSFIYGTCSTEFSLLILMFRQDYDEYIFVHVVRYTHITSQSALHHIACKLVFISILPTILGWKHHIS